MTYSFGLNVFDYLRALQESVERFRLDYLNKVLAQDCACNAWHLQEHVFRVPQVERQFVKCNDFRRYVTDACPELDLLRVICNAKPSFRPQVFKPSLTPMGRRNTQTS